MRITDLTALELGKKLREKEISAVEAAQESLAQIKATEETIHAYVTVDEEGAKIKWEQQGSNL